MTQAISQISNLERLVRVHNRAKALYILAEELEPDRFKTYVQPNQELRSALDHLLRAKANELGLDTEPQNQKYIEESINKALGHGYRAFFDSADWLSTILREAITTLLNPYSRECIVDVFPDYYSTMRPKIDKISRDIADIRNEKDIAKEHDLEEVENYNRLIEELISIRDQIVLRIGALEDWKKRQRRTDWGKAILWLVGGIIMTLIGCWIKSRF